MVDALHFTTIVVDACSFLVSYRPESTDATGANRRVAWECFFSLASLSEHLFGCNVYVACSSATSYMRGAVCIRIHTGIFVIVLVYVQC